MYNLTEFKEGTNLFLNNQFEKNLVQGNGNAYGLELTVKKHSGRYQGWLSYGLQWSNRQFTELNTAYFPAKYDRRHVLSFVNTVKISERINLGIVWEYASGAKITAITGQYLSITPSLNGANILPIYSKKNEISLSPSHRLDLSISIKEKKRTNRVFNGEWSLGAYNVYNRTTPFQILITNQNNTFKYKQYGIFGFIPYLSYNFKF